MTWNEAKDSLKVGKLIKLPEWTGFWYLTKEGNLNVFTAEGTISNEPHVGKYMDRIDWEETEGYRDIGGMIKALKSPGSIVKSAVREGIEGKLKFEKCPYPAIVISFVHEDMEVWVPTNEDLLAEDYVVWDTELLNQ